VARGGRRALVVAALGVGLWLAGAATASADTGIPTTPVAGLVGVVPQTVDAVVAPVPSSSATQPVVPALHPVVEVAAGAVSHIAAPVDAAVAGVARPVRPAVALVLDTVLTPVADEVVTPVVQRVHRVVDAPLGPLADDVMGSSLPTVAAAATTSSLSGTLPDAPSGPPPAPRMITTPAAGAGNAPTGSDGGLADVPGNALRAALTAAAAFPDAARDAVGIAAFDPSFSPD
jgi:predicted regulator of amino acid metabolism with ACT domain